MPFPTFSAGNVLTASDMNAVGLWLVKTQTIGTAVATVDVTSCFSSSYQHYKIVVDQVTGMASGANFGARMLVGTTPNTGNIYGILMYASVASSAAYVGVNDNNANQFTYLSGTGNGNVGSFHFDIQNPFEARETRLGPVGFVKTVGATDIGFYMGALYNSTSYNGIRIQVGTGTMTGGTIRVYGYKP